MVRREPDEDELQLAEKRVGEAKERIRELQHDLVDYEQRLPNDIERAKTLYKQEDGLSPEDAAVGLREELAYTLDDMDLAVQDVEQYFDRKRVLKGPKRKIGQLPQKDRRSYQGEKAADRLHTLLQEAEELEETLDNINDHMEDLYDVQRNLPDYLAGDRTFEPHDGYDLEPVATGDREQDTPDGEEYGMAELTAGIMEARGRQLRDEHGSYEAAHERVQEMVADDLGDWYNEG